MQAINIFFGGTMTKAIKPMHGKISTITTRKNKIFSNIPARFNVVRYHSLVCDLIPDELEIIASTKEEEVMALSHKSLPIWGLQFHPEAALTTHGLKILRNWAKHSYISN
jgi:anthranilate synthase component 2